MSITASTVAGIAGAALAVGTLIATLVYNKSTHNGNTTYETKGQGPVETTYTQPQAPQPMPQPMCPPPYASMYPWGYNAYIATIANTPMQSPAMSYGYAYTPYTPWYSPQVYSYNFNNPGQGYNNGVVTNPIRPSPPGAPPGSTCPQQCTYNWNGDGYTRTYPNGSVSFAPIPSCYDDYGRWRG
jgi:hypothetical protein